MQNKDKELFEFLSTAPKRFRDNEQIKKYQMKNGDFIHCVLWNLHFYITGTDIVKILLYRFQTSGRQLVNLKKFEEGIFSDLRNLKPGIDATLEGPRSEFLEFLYKNGCIRTQKKQKVFYWFSVPHDALFCDALERDLRRETNLQTYNKYMSTLNRPIADHGSFKPYAMQRSFSDFETSMKPSGSLNIPNGQNLFIPTGQPIFFDSPHAIHSHNSSQINSPLDSQHPTFFKNFSTGAYSSSRVYPDFVDSLSSDNDMFYKDSTHSRKANNFYEIGSPRSRTPESKISSKHQVFSMSDFDFLKDKVSTNKPKEQNDRNVDDKHTINNLDDFEIFGRF